MAALLIKGIPEKLRNEFKALCSLGGDSMRKVLIDFMREKVEAAIGNEKGQEAE